MSGRFRDTTCERALAWASLELDDELSQLERALLASHLRDCDACAASVVEMRALTTMLREAPVEEPRRRVFTPGPRAPARRSRMPARLALAATLAALAAGLGALAGSVGQAPDVPVSGTEPEIALLPTDDELRDVRRVRPRSDEARDERLFPPGRLGGV
jgi:anti-sigma factor RsiW